MELTVVIGIFTHCAIDDVIAPTLSYPIISIPICLLITLNLYMHYYYAMTIPPGFLDGPPPEPVNSFLWARKVNDDKGRQAMSPRGSTWWDRGVRITPGCPTECPKCDKFRPEVGLIPFFSSHAKSNSKSRERTIVGYAKHAYSSMIITVP